MRIAIVWPWFRTLGHLYGKELEKLGHDVLLVTSERHFAGGQYEQVHEVLATQVGVIPSIKSILKARKALKAFKPDVIVVEDVYSHPIWWAARLFGVPLVGSIHDPMPHDANHTRTGLRKLVSSIQNMGMDGTIYYSRAAAREAHELGIRPDTPAYVWPLISEMPDGLVPDATGHRSGFALVGRWSYYKGFDIGIDAWRALPEGVRNAHPLHVWHRMGSNRPPFEDAALTWHPGGYEWDEIAAMLSRVAYVLLPYRTASQSGVQVLAQQCGARVIYTDLPGLREFHAPGDIAVASVDPRAWTQALLEASQLPEYEGTPVTFASRGFTEQLAQSVNAMENLVQ
jgi:glycosyltransferase involved in cell wall biosynthesis